ncbi:phosphatidylinositol 3 and 4-kinase-domain-containing protein, partial [Thamnidium elegans]|uniref:Phosphatidylinositol 4-kinase n=1 Tax=Thamnidium elegans TaxID=101142 RepID=A0A8H7W115_9FUNG
MFKSQNPSMGNGQYSRIEQHDEEEDTMHHELLQHHPNSVLVANHHGQCNVVPALSQQSLPVPASPPHSPRASFSATNIPDATRRFFQTKLPIVFRKDMASTASFSSLPAVIIADLQNGNIPDLKKTYDENSNVGDQGWAIVHRRRFKGKNGIGETRHPANINSTVNDTVLDEEIDPSDQVTCSVFVKWEVDQQPKQYMMAMAPLYESNQNEEEREEERNFEDPIPETEDKFNDIVQSVRTAIDNNMQPTRISQGSSGSYFCRNSSGKIVGVFKPKNEEPYGRLNPKWTKWIHRHLFPCFFGRSCLIPNLGYLSEAAASLIDRRLGTMIVPYTDVIHLSSSSFHYDYLDRRSQNGLPPKIGSFQCFLTNYKDATVFFRDHPYSEDGSDHSLQKKSVWGGCLGSGGVMDTNEEDGAVLYHYEDDSDHTHVANASNSSTHHYPPKQQQQQQQQQQQSKKSDENNNKHQFKWSYQLQNQFKREFEQLVILDYLIRNTDRGLDNWMVKYCPPAKTHKHNNSSSSSLSADEQSHNHKSNSNRGHIHVAAIDNGLAFPYKHPDQWRSYPYGWMAMPDALVNRPFTEATRKQFLAILSDPLWWRETVREMRSLFEMDDDFDEKMFQKQMAVLKGQGYNILRTLKDPSAGPVDLVAMQRVVINQEEILIEYDERTLTSRDLHVQSSTSHASSPALDITDALPKPRRLRTQRSTSFDVISTVSSPFHDEDEEQELDQRVQQLKQLQRQQKQQKRWQDKIKNGLTMDLGGRGLFGQKKKKTKKNLNRYRAFDSDGDISDGYADDSDSDEEEEPKLKRVTVIIETIQVVKSRTYFTCC